MEYKKMFFPIGGGDELEERLYGACLVAKYFHAHIEFLKSGYCSNIELYNSLDLPKQMTYEIDNLFDAKYKDENIKYKTLLQKVAQKVGIKFEDVPSDRQGVSLKIRKGYRSILVEEESKFCDLVIAAAPPSGNATSTFETAVMKSGKPVIMIPRIMKNFSAKSVIIGWNNSIEAARTLTASMEILKDAERVHVISSKEYMKDEGTMENLMSYLALHKIDATFEVVEITQIPGEALLNNALDGNFDLIVAGAYSYKGLKELMFGGTTKHLLKYSTIPVFMSY
jgi:nucleotide-binding universal stress UspA family protein